MYDLVRSVILLLAMGFLAGCGGEREGTTSPGRDPDMEALSAMRDRSDQDETSDARLVTIELLNRDTDKPVSGATLRLYCTAVDSPSKVQAKEVNTNLDGEAIFNIPEVERLMVRSEYCLEFTELKPSAKGATLRVQPYADVQGRVVDVNGSGVEGATVFVAGFGSTKERESTTPPLPGAGLEIVEFRRLFGYDMLGEAVTNGEGRFSCRVKTFMPLAAAAYKDGLLCPNWTVISFSGNEPSFEAAEILLFPKARLELTYYDARNRPLPNYLISLVETLDSRARRSEAGHLVEPFSTVAPTDAWGKLEIDVPSGVDIALQRGFFFSDPGESGKLPDPVRTKPIDVLKPSPGETLKIAATPPRTIRLHGVIRDVEGNPLPGADLFLQVNSLKTGDEGQFSLVIPYNVYKRLAYTVWKRGYQPKGGLLPEIGENTMELELEAVLEKAPELTLVVDTDVDRAWLSPINTAGRIEPAEGVEAELLPDPVGLVGGTKTGERAFTFRGLMPGEFTALAQHGAFHFAPIESVRVLDSVKKDVHVLPGMLDASASIEGRVTYPEKMKPQAMQVVLMRNDVPEVRRWDPMAMGKTGFGWAMAPVALDGSFSFDSLAPGRYALTSALVEWDLRLDLYEERIIEAGVNRITLGYEASRSNGTLKIFICDEARNPLPGLGMLLLDPVDSPLGRPNIPLTFSNGEGLILVEGLSPGRYGFAIRRPDGSGYMLNGRVKVEGDRVAELTIVLNQEA